MSFVVDYNFLGGKNTFVIGQFLNPSNKNSHKKCKPDFSISVKKVQCILGMPCLALPSPPLPFAS